MRRFFKAMAVFIAIALIFTAFTIVEIKSSPQQLSASTGQEITYYTSTIKPLVNKEMNVTVDGQHSSINVEICYYTGPMQQMSGIGLSIYIMKEGSSQGTSPYITAQVSAVTLFYSNYSFKGNILNNFTLSTINNNGVQEIGTHSFFNGRILVTSFSTGIPGLGPTNVTMNGTLTVTILPEALYGPYHIQGTPIVISHSFRQVLVI